jgi:hypothetical protein
MSATNIYPLSGSLSGETIIEFPIPVKYLAITNTSGSAELRWKFRSSQDSDYLAPTEIITMENVHVHQIILSANNGSYRVNGRG